MALILALGWKNILLFYHGHQETADPNVGLKKHTVVLPQAPRNCWSQRLMACIDRESSHLCHQRSSLLLHCNLVTWDHAGSDNTESGQWRQFRGLSYVNCKWFWRYLLTQRQSTCRLTYDSYVYIICIIHVLLLRIYPSLILAIHRHRPAHAYSTVDQWFCENANTRICPNVVSLLGQRRRRWANIETIWGQVLVFSGICALGVGSVSLALFWRCFDISIHVAINAHIFGHLKHI